MKKSLIVILLLSAAYISKAQKLEKPKIDKITGDTTFSTSKEIITNKVGLIYDYLGVKTIKTKGDVFLSFYISKGITMLYSVNPGDKLILKTTDDKVLEIKSIASQNSDFTHSSANTYSDLIALYPVSSDDLIKLKAGTIKVIRIETSKGNFDYDIKLKNADIIKKQIELITK